MKRADVIRILQQNQQELSEKFGVDSLSLFGSFVREENTALSDIDLLVEFQRPVGLFGLFALQNHLEDLFGCPVDLGTPKSLKPRIKEQVLAECVHVA